MSREIDRSDLSSLSREDLEYLRDRSQLTPDEEREFLGGDVLTTMGEDPTANPPTEPGQSSGVDDDGDDLESMSKAELQEELGEGNYPSSANKGELIELIRERNQG